MRKTRLSIRGGGAVGVTSPAQCSLTVLWQVAFHHQHQSITPPLPPPPPPPGRNLHGIICRGVTAAGRHRRGSIHIPIWGWILSPSCYHLHFLNIRAVTESKIVVLCISKTKHLILQMWTVDTGQTQKLQKKRNIDSQQFILSTEWSVSLGGERV